MRTVAAAAAVSQPTADSPVVERIPGRICNVDGDYLAYWAAVGDENEVGMARRIARERIETYRDMSGSESVELHLSARGGTKGERFLIATLKKYQGQRGGSHPVNWEPLRVFLESHQCAKNWFDREADDAFALASGKTRDPISQCVIVTADKDMRMVPGTHLHWKDFTQVQVPRGAYEVISPYDGKVFGHKWFWLQMLQGDTADNIPGIPKVGETIASELLAGTTCNGEAFEVTCREYQRYYDRVWADAFVEMASLLWMRVGQDASVADYLRVVPGNIPVIEATKRLVTRVTEERAQINRVLAQAAAYQDAAGTEQ